MPSAAEGNLQWQRCSCLHPGTTLGFYSSCKLTSPSLPPSLQWETEYWFPVNFPNGGGDRMEGRAQAGWQEQRGGCWVIQQRAAVHKFKHTFTHLLPNKPPSQVETPQRPPAANTQYPILCVGGTAEGKVTMESSFQKSLPNDQSIVWRVAGSTLVGL